MKIMDKLKASRLKMGETWEEQGFTAEYTFGKFKLRGQFREGYRQYAFNTLRDLKKKLRHELKHPGI